MISLRIVVVECNLSMGFSIYAFSTAEKALKSALMGANVKGGKGFKSVYRLSIQREKGGAESNTVICPPEFLYDSRKRISTFEPIEAFINFARLTL